MNKRDRAKDVKEVRRSMSPTQRRRLDYYIKGESLTYIAKKEGVSVVAVWKSIKGAKIRGKKRVGWLRKG